MWFEDKSRTLRVTLSMLVGSARVLLLRVSNTRSCSSKMVRWAVGGVSTLTADTDLSVIATFDAGKYLFNAPEQFSRACIQHRRGFRKINAIFLTRIHSDTSAGLPGARIHPALLRSSRLA